MDLNLLRVLVALDETRSVSRGADMLEMSQSGFSTALARLRKSFDDEMFIRVQGRMQPTSRATAALPTARDILAKVQHEILCVPAFAPSSSRTRFSLAMADIAELVYLPKLLNHFASAAPHVSVITQLPPGNELRESMADGKIDLAVGYFPDLSTQEFFKQRLYEHGYVCMMRKGHPLQDGLSIDAYQRCGHVVPSKPTRSMALVEEHLVRRRIRRTIVLETPHHLVLGAIVAQTDLIATIPIALAAELRTSHMVQAISLPFAAPKFLVQQHWHRSVHRDVRVTWLRTQVRDLFVSRSQSWSDLEGALNPGRRVVDPLATRERRRPA